MTYGQAIVTVKSLNSPDPTADLAEKFEAIKKITEMATINSLNKADLMRCVKWLLERSEAANDRLTAYEDTGMEPEDILSATDMGKVACALHELNRYKDLGDLDRLCELVEADLAGRCVKKNDNRDIYMDRDCQHFTPATNADRIRSMTDEELAGHIWNKFGCPDGKNHVTCGCLGSCKECWLDWLKQPAKDE